jgi:hypothetical protein
MNAGSIFAILILTMEVAYICSSVECQAHIILDMGCDCLCPSMTIMTLVHSMHQLCMGVESRHVNQRQFKQDIPIKAWWKKLYPLNIKIFIIKTPNCIPSSLCGLKPLQGIYNTERLLMINMGWRMANQKRSRSPLNQDCHK